MKTLLVALAVGFGALFAVPFAVPAAAQDGNAGEDQYGNRGVGDRASEDAVRADEAVTPSGTFSEVVTTGSQDGAALAAEPRSAPPEATPTQDATAEAGDGGYEGDDSGGSETDEPGGSETDEPGGSETDEPGGSEGPALTELPDTGGVWPLIVVGVMLMAGGLLVAWRELSR